MTKQRAYAKDMIYHVYNRGNKKQKTFFDDQDFKFFMSRLLKYCKECKFKILFYCLMPNHYHVCLEQTSEISLEKLMRKLMISYAMYFNKKYITVGHVFQGKFKYKHVNTEEYLVYLSAYVHLNPVEIAELDEYVYSSYKEYIRFSNGICDKNKILKGMLDHHDYREYIHQIRMVRASLEHFNKDFETKYYPEFRK